MPSTDALYDLLKTRRPHHVPWSLVELKAGDEIYGMLLTWARELSWSDFDFQAHSARTRLGAVLLWLETEVARRHCGEGRLWKEVLANQAIVAWPQHTWERLFNPAGHPQFTHKQLLREAAMRLQIRHAFDEDDAHHWYRLIFLQFGFTHEDATQRLSAWLSGQIAPVSVQGLLTGNDPGAMNFQTLWRSLRQFKRGYLARWVMKERLAGCCWVLPEWSDELMAAALAATIPEDQDENEDEWTLFKTPRLFWDQLSQPWFGAELEMTGASGLVADTYVVSSGAAVLATLVQQADGSFASDQLGMVQIGIGHSAKPQVEVRVVSTEGELARLTSLLLWNADRDVTVFRASNGQLQESESELRQGQAFDAITPADICFLPQPSVTVNIGQGFRLHRFESGWTGLIQAHLDDFTVWSSAGFGQPSSPLPENLATADWTESVDSRAQAFANQPAPWSLGLRVRIADKAWSMKGFRWTRADGMVLRRPQPPPHLTLVEQDVGKPVILRLTLASGHQTVTISVSLPVPFIGCLRWTGDGRPRLQSCRHSVSLMDVRRSLWKFFLPPKVGDRGMPGVLEPRSCSIMEGDCVRGNLRSQAGSLPEIAGYGAPIFISTDPYNSDEHLLNVAASVFDGGVLGKVTIFQQTATALRWGNFELGENHQLLGWFSSSTEAGRLLEIDAQTRTDTDSGWEIPIPNGWWLTSLVLLYRGERIGSWFDASRWSVVMLRAESANIVVMAALLRSWKAPILHSKGDTDHSERVVGWLQNHWHDVVPVWLLPKDEVVKADNGEEFLMPSLDGPWLESVNALLCKAQPKPDRGTVKSFIATLATKLNSQKPQEVVGYAMIELVQVCPLLAARSLKTFIQHHGGELPQGGVLLLQQMSAIFPFAEAVAETLAANHGGRDGQWLRTAIPSLREVDQRPESLDHTYRKLAKNRKFRELAFGVWVCEIKKTLHL